MLPFESLPFLKGGSSLIYTAKNFTGPNRHLNQLHGLMNYLAMYNLMRWGIGSFLERDFQTQRINLKYGLMQRSITSSSAWNVVAYIFEPPVIYLHYISTFLLLQITYLIRTNKRSNICSLSVESERAT